MDEEPMAEAVGRIYVNKYAQVHSMLVFTGGNYVVKKHIHEILEKSIVSAVN